MNRVLCFGSLNIDYTYKVEHFAAKGETVPSTGLNLFTGGKGLNQSVALARAGLNVEHAGAIGRDGEFLLEFLNSNGVDTSRVEVLRDIRTGNAIIQNDTAGDNCIILYGGANRQVTREYIDSILDSYMLGDYCVVQNEISETPYILSQAHSKGIITVLNPSPVSSELCETDPETVDVLILNAVEAGQLCGCSAQSDTPEAIDRLVGALHRKYTRAEIILTLGERGSVYYDGVRTVRQDAYSATAVDTTAAGDTFTGYFLAGKIAGLSVEECLNRASAAAALSVMKPGAAPSIPSSQDVDSALAGRQMNFARHADETFGTLLKRKVILDCDTGSDDAVAIMLAILADNIDLIGICTVAGNKNIDFTTENTLAVVEALHADIPVFRGCSSSIVTGLHPGRRGKYDGMSGVSSDNRDENGEVISYHSDHLPLPEPTIHESAARAVPWLIDTLMKSDGDITLVMTGPMTNLAMAMRLEPAICGKIKEIIFMGGGFKVFNATSASEFNVWTDPEAAQIVVTSGVRVTMVPLDATHRANFSLTDCDEIDNIGTMVAHAVADMTRKRIAAYDLYQPQEELHTAPIHDALALSYLIDPLVLKDIRLMRVDVDFSGGYADGQTICDTRTYPDREPNVYVALDADRERFVKLAKDLISKAR